MKWYNPKTTLPKTFKKSWLRGDLTMSRTVVVRAKFQDRMVEAHGRPDSSDYRAAFMYYGKHQFRFAVYYKPEKLPGYWVVDGMSGSDIEVTQWAKLTIASFNKGPKKIDKKK